MKLFYFLKLFSFEYKIKIQYYIKEARKLNSEIYLLCYSHINDKYYDIKFPIMLNDNIDGIIYDMYKNNIHIINKNFLELILTIFLRKNTEFLK